MTRIALPLSILAAAVLSACSSPGPSSPAGASQPIATQEMPYRSGSGVVQSVNPTPSAVNASSGGSAASQTPASASASGLSRLGIKMDDGRMQYVDTGNRDFAVGTRVRLTENRQIERQ